MKFCLTCALEFPILTLLILIIVALATWVCRENDRRPEKVVFDILKERYARGVINQSECEQKQRDLDVS